MSDTVMRSSVGICVVASVASITGSVLRLNDNSPNARRACDAEVHQLLTTRDPLELRRTAILVREMRCDVARRRALAAGVVS